MGVRGVDDAVNLSEAADAELRRHGYDGADDLLETLDELFDLFCVSRSGKVVGLRGSAAAELAIVVENALEYPALRRAFVEIVDHANRS